MEKQFLQKTKRPSVVVRIMGGLGNQLFCYAAARRLAHINNAELILDVYTGYTKDITYKREYLLHQFAISAREEKSVSLYERIRRAINKRISNLRLCCNEVYVKEKSPYEIDERILNLRVNRSVYLTGYWQSPRYFEDINDIIRKEFQIVAPISQEWMREAEMIRQIPESIAVGIRRYVEVKQIGAHQVIHLDYYVHAAEFMLRHFPKASFFIFTDDNNWVKANLHLPSSLTFIQPAKGNSDAYQKFWLMTQCRHFIISNSSFDWWAAWLAAQNGKMVVAPNRGFSNKDMIPNNWLKIDARTA